jgi:CheY-like chemotaxis protein
VAVPGNVLSGFQILVIDDNPTAREILTLALRHSGATVATAPGARAALDVLRRFTPDVILVDLRLPDEGASWIVGEARKIGITAAFIAVAGGDFNGDSLRADGFHAYLHKPVDRGRLFDAILSAACDAGA